MNKKTLYLILLALMICVLCGCAKDIIKTIKIEYTPSHYSKVTDATKTIEVNRLKDVRGVDPRLFYIVDRKKGGVYHFPESYPPLPDPNGLYVSRLYVSEREVPDIVTEAIKNLLIKQNYRIVNDKGILTLTGEILKFQVNVPLVYLSCQTEGHIQVNLRLLDNRDGNIRWNEIFSGNGKKTGVHVKEVIEMALDNLMSNISNSTSFKKAIERSE